MLRLKRLPLFVVSVLGYLIIMLTFSGSVTPAYGQDMVRGIPSLGSGPYEVIMFADYFCPPCRRIDSKAEPLLKELLATGKVKITFVDVPFSSPTPIYAKYYLYMVNENDTPENVFHARNILFEAAQIHRIQTEDALISYLKEKGISWKYMNEKSIYPLLTAVAKNHKISSTPTCAIKYSTVDVRRFVGSENIWEGLKKLKADLES